MISHPGIGPFVSWNFPHRRISCFGTVRDMLVFGKTSTDVERLLVPNVMLRLLFYCLEMVRLILDKSFLSAVKLIQRVTVP